ncbi:unnamed protein product [Ceratitis capitata]|uniref:(Mediterranean fruit fly) hypothetical protein n=1 Tax=Ceratitis capitata TaxID=7213 RepID=A0A811U564_CERCA|nr:unnamed protein product [Ceratitis capitata]
MPIITTALKSKADESAKSLLSHQRTMNTSSLPDHSTDSCSDSWLPTNLSLWYRGYSAENLPGFSPTTNKLLGSLLCVRLCSQLVTGARFCCCIWDWTGPLSCPRLLQLQPLQQTTTRNLQKHIIVSSE